MKNLLKNLKFMNFFWFLASSGIFRFFFNHSKWHQNVLGSLFWIFWTNSHFFVFCFQPQKLFTYFKHWQNWNLENFQKLLKSYKTIFQIRLEHLNLEYLDLGYLDLEYLNLEYLNLEYLLLEEEMSIVFWFVFNH